MKPTLVPGISFVRKLSVDRDRTIGFMGEEGRVYATPSLVSDMEYTCRELLMQHADADEDSVGIEVFMQHLAPTLLGMTVEFTVTVVGVEGRKVHFEAEARDDVETIGKGKHTRFVVDVAKRRESLKAKARKRDAACGI